MIAGRIFGRAVTLSAAIALAYALPVDAAELTLPALTVKQASGGGTTYGLTLQVLLLMTARLVARSASVAVKVMEFEPAARPSRARRHRPWMT